LNPEVAKRWNEIVNVLGRNPAEQYVAPPDTDAALLDSLCWHGRKYREVEENTVEPSLDEFKVVVTRVCQDLGILYSVPDYMNWDIFEKILQEVDPKKSPGYPFKSWGITTNKQILESSLMLVQLYRMVHERLDKLSRGVVGGDDINLFIKNEPHKKSKAASKRWRLISGVGLVDNIVDRFLFGGLLEKVDELAKRMKIPILAGWVPWGGGYRALSNTIKNPQSCDKSAWDWTLQSWIVQGFQQILLTTQCNGTWSRAIDARLATLFNASVFRVGERRFRQKVVGIMKSGFLGTIVFNSIGQMLIHHLSLLRGNGKRLPYFVVGDDMVTEKQTSAYWSAVETSGCALKEYQKDAGYPTEFMGVKFSANLILPAYPDKNMFSLLIKEPEILREALRCYQLLYSHHPLRAVVADLAKAHDVLIPEREVKAWVEGWESM
jgi:hypothetical protein